MPLTYCDHRAIVYRTVTLSPLSLCQWIPVLPFYSQLGGGRQGEHYVAGACWCCVRAAWAAA
jgi:hypothetical protein